MDGKDIRHQKSDIRLCLHSRYKPEVVILRYAQNDNFGLIADSLQLPWTRLRVVTVGVLYLYRAVLLVDF